MCETRWQNRKDLTWSGFQVNKACLPRPLSATRQPQNARITGSRTCDATAHQMAAMRRRHTLKAARFLRAVPQKKMELSSQLLHFSLSGHSDSAVNKKLLCS